MKRRLAAIGSEIARRLGVSRQAARQHYQRRHHGKADRDDHQDDAARGANTGDPPGVSSISRDSHNGVLPVADGTATLSMKSSDQAKLALIEALTTAVAPML